MQNCFNVEKKVWNGFLYFVIFGIQQESNSIGVAKLALLATFDIFGSPFSKHKTKRENYES